MQASLILLLIRNIRLIVNSRNGSTTAVHRAEDAGMNSARRPTGRAERERDQRYDGQATLVGAREPVRSSWTCAMTGNSTRFTIRPNTVAGITIRL